MIATPTSLDRVKTARFDAIDVTSRQGVNELIARVREVGLGLFSGISDRQSLVRLADEFGQIRPHRDSESDGITRIAVTHDGLMVGKKGFSNRGLGLHTDQSGEQHPAELLMMVMEQPATSGGESAFADSAQIYQHLCSSNMEALLALMDPESVVFRGGNCAQWKPIFEQRHDGSIVVRFRNDDLGYFARKLFGPIEEFERAAAQRAVHFNLSVGCGVVLSNTRWLHGRTPFVGERVLMRVLLDARADFPIGFRPA